MPSLPRSEVIDLQSHSAGQISPVNHDGDSVTAECLADMFVHLQRNNLNVNTMLMNPRTYADLMNTFGKRLPCDEWNSGYDGSARY